MECLWNDQKLSIAIGLERKWEVCWKLLVIFFFFFQSFAHPNDYLNNKRDFLRKIAPEIVVCHVEAVRQGTVALPPTKVNDKTK